MRRSELWRQRAAELEAFIDGARDLQDFYDSGASDASRERELRVRVARCAGTAGPIAGRLGLFGHIAGMKLNPILAWERFIPGELLTHPGQAIEFAETARGACIAAADQAIHDESGIAGRLARLVRFPHDVRDRAGLTTKLGSSVAFWSAVAAEVVAAVIFALLVALAGVLVTR